MRISDWSSDVCSSDLLPGQEENIRSGRSDFAGEQGIRQWGGLLKIDRSSEAGILSLLSAYRAERSYNSEDIDRTAASLFAYSASQKTWAKSQALRFVSADEVAFSDGERLHWSAGLYWFPEDGWREQNALGNVFTPTNRAG